MENPNIKQKFPVTVELEKGKKYFWCACGNSNNEKGFCDGSHKGTSFTPLGFSVEKDRKAAICMCKHSNNKPYCDGTHQNL